MSIGNLYTAQFRFESPSSGFTCSMGYRQLSGTNDENTLTDLAVALDSLVEPEFKAAMSNQVSMTSILTYQVTGANETPGRTRFELPNIGGVASEALPMGAAVVLSILTDAPNAKFNGRMYMAGVPEFWNDAGAVDAAGLIFYGLLATALQTTTGALGPGLAVFQPVVISRILNGVPRVPPISHDIVSISVDPFIKNQRRRNTRFLGAGGTT